MRIAQGLYERGYITYMRTDSTTLSEQALTAARSQIADRYGTEFLPDQPRVYKGKAKNAQEAHEAIRPAGDRFHTPEEVAGELSAQDLRVYELIWQRTVASQMTDATGETVTIRLGVDTTDARHATFSTSGTTIRHQGFQKVYREDVDEDDQSDDAVEQQLPPLDEGDSASVLSADAEGHDTQPPARYTEASLVKKLEELEVGRPSTYASIMRTIQDREYVWKRGSALVPSFKAFAVVTLLEEHFPDLVDYAFTAQMENDLDEIALGGEERVPWLTRFYFGGGDDPGLKAKVSDQLDEIDARAINSIPIGTDAEGQMIVARVGRYGPYLERGEARASIPNDILPDELTVERALELINAPQGDRQVGTHPDTGQPIFVKNGRFGPYVQLGERVEESGDKPKMESLFKTMDPESLTLEQALRLLSLPRVVGVDEEDREILARNGRYGPYISRTISDGDKDKTDSRSLEAEDQLFTISESDARALLAQPKRRRGQQAAKPGSPVGTDPATDKPVELKEGRFGPYVTDGETNASLRKGDDPETITIERASELLADRRAAGPAKKKKKAAKKKKKAVAKKANPAKSPAKKAVARKKAATTKKAATKGPAKSSVDTAEDPF
jgi:DNA topoisomerase-1